MPLVNMKQLLLDAREGGYAVGAFNPVDYNSMKAIVTAAEQLEAPVIAQTSAKTVQYWGHATCAAWMCELAEDSPVPVAFHLDHCKDIDFIRKCIDHGWTNVMIDASSFPFEKNLEMTCQVIEMATVAGVGVEAELGQIVGVEDDIFVHENDSQLTEPDTAVEFCKGLDLAVFAPAIGTAHGLYKGEPEVAFDRIEEIARRTGIPIALHGGTGLADDVIQKSIQLGCAKVNISTELKHVFVDTVCDYHTQNPNDYEPLRVIQAQGDALTTLFAEKIKQFGGAGKAAQYNGVT